MQVVKRYILYFFVLFLTAILFNISTPAQNKDKTTNWPEPVFEHITLADGLPENSVQCIFQDHLGYMWFGTQNGLVRYDGYEMKVYKPDPDDSLSISYREIYSIYEDRSGNLWIGAGRGLNHFNRTTESFKRYLHKPDDTTSINSGDVFSIYEDKAGDLLVGTGKGLNLFNRHTEKFKHIYYQDSVYSESVYKYIQSLIDGGKTISSILRVGNNADLKKTFTINKKTVVLTVVMGEGGFDEGWVERSDGKLVTGKFNNKVQYARGNIRRYINSVIQVFIDTLNSGSYRLHYKSDYAWSYNQWGDTPPTYPEFWGIQVIELPESFENTSELLNSTEPAIVNYRAPTIMEDLLTQYIYRQQ